MWKQVIMSSAILFGGTLVSRFFTFLYIAILIRELTVADYAIFSLLMSILTWVLIFSHFDLYAAVSKFVSEKIALGRTEVAWNYHYNATVLAILFSSFGVMVAFAFSLKTPASRPYAILFFLSLVPMSLMTVNDGLIKGHQNFTLSAIVDISGGISKFLLISGFILINGGLRLNDSLMLLFVASVVPLVASFVAMKRLLPPGIAIKRHISKEKWTRLFGYSKWVCITDLASAGIILALNLMFSFYSYEDLARFAVIILIYSIFQLGFGAITNVLIPKVSSVTVNNQKIHILGKKELAYLFCGTFLVSVVMYNLPYQENILQFLFRKTNYSESLKYVSIILLSMPLRIVTTTNKGILQGIDYPEDGAKASLMTIIFIIVVMVPLYRLLRLEGIILAILMTYCFEYFLYNRAVRQRGFSPRTQ